MSDTIAGLVHAAAERLIAAGIPAIEARLDAELLARHGLGDWDRSTYIVRAREPFPREKAAAFEALVARRSAREPIAYIVGHAEFWGLQFEVTPAVLIPRPETELIVESVLQLPLLRASAERVGRHVGQLAAGESLEARQVPLHVVDVGTGSGCLAVALARELPDARLTATDTSAEAIEVARRNARRHGVEARIAFRVSSLTGQADDCDLIVSNPPYVPERERSSLQPEVRDHEPATALFAGDDGLAVIRELVEVARHALRSGGGWLVFEFGFGQADAVRAVLETTPAGDDLANRHRWSDVRVATDLQGIPRVAIARKVRTSEIG